MIESCFPAKLAFSGITRVNKPMHSKLVSLMYTGMFLCVYLFLAFLLHSKSNVFVYFPLRCFLSRTIPYCIIPFHIVPCFRFYSLGNASHVRPQAFRMGVDRNQGKMQSRDWDEPAQRQANGELLDHQRKRKVQQNLGFLGRSYRIAPETEKPGNESYHPLPIGTKQFTLIYSN